MMEADHGLAYLLRFRNIAWYQEGCVRILDRRVYPMEERFRICRTYGEVADAIRDMVTQSYGPFHAVCMGMTLAAYECRDLPGQEQRDFLHMAADRLATARPTTERKMRIWTDGCLKAANEAIDGGGDACQAIMADSVARFGMQYDRIRQIGRYLAQRVPQGGCVMTQCYGDADVGMLLLALQEAGKGDVRFFCPETRPYLQGARLTASVIRDMGFDVTLITDNMPAWTLKTKGVDVFTSAADVICMDGHVVNKVGTFQIALAADYLGVPYYVTGNPDAAHPTVDTVRIEERNPAEVTEFLGSPICKNGVKAYYPAFDITPPSLVKGVVTDRGILPADGLADYFDQR